MKPCKRKDFIRKLRILGFIGPFSGSKHHFMIFENFRLSIPSNEEYSVPQLKMMLKEIEEILSKKIDNVDWNNL
jgi:hypothetical protein